MTQEEKAKRYDEAVEKFDVILNLNTVKESGTIFADDVRKIFPELKESEDTKIRRCISDVIKEHDWSHIFGVTKNDCLSWIEKQGEQKPDTDFSDLRTWKYIVDAVWTEKEGIGQYLDSPFTEEIAKKLQKRFGNIEQKPVIEEVNGEDYGIDGLWHAQRILEKTLGGVNGYQSDDGILEHKAAITAVKKLYEQKPAEWSEEDEKFFNTSLWHICNSISNGKYTDIHCDTTDWFISLKERVQLQNTWKPSEGQMRALDIAIRCGIQLGSWEEEALKSLKKELEKLYNYEKKEIY